MRDGVTGSFRQAILVVLHRRTPLIWKSQPMQRRQFLRWTSASLAVMSAHSWLSGCSKEPSVSTTDSGQATSHGEPAGQEVTASAVIELSADQIIELDFAATVERARSIGKPVLVFVAPPMSERQGRLRQEFADFLKCADDELWRDLALCELACASVSEISTAIPKTTHLDSALFAIVEHDSGRSAVASTMETPSKDCRRAVSSQDEWLQLQRERFGGWKSYIHRAVAADRSHLMARADAARLAQPAVAARVESFIQSGEEPDVDLLRDASALFAKAALEHPKKCGHFADLVATSTRSRVMARGFSGAGWGSFLSCASEKEEAPRRTKHERKEDDEMSLVLCGMGFVDEYSERFLWFYTDEAR
ncbi:MAG TPA: hypothetical protein VM509_12185 [Planctomycetota bacterium]|nr:hypothetical protein [Planctomycetota bacterium]